MSDMEKLLEEISKKNFQKEKYVKMVISDETFRKFVIDSMINNPKIMNYYHCFYIIEEASSIKPELFYKYWDDFVILLNHSNSYHRDFGLILIAKLAKCDEDNKVDKIINDYLELLKDEKFMTAECCLKNSFIIATLKENLLEKIVIILLNLEVKNHYSEKQAALMMGFIIEGLNQIFDKYAEKKSLLDFVRRHLESISPKTRKIARKFLSKH